jgi:hypothetical protein
LEWHFVVQAVEVAGFCPAGGRDRRRPGMTGKRSQPVTWSLDEVLPVGRAAPDQKRDLVVQVVEVAGLARPAAATGQSGIPSVHAQETVSTG